MQDFERMNTQDRVFSFRPKDSKKLKNDMMDPRLIDGKNKLHAVQDAATCLWSLKYEHGQLPEALRDSRFTRFDTLQKAVEVYYGSRGYEVILNAVEQDVKSSNA